MPQVVTNKTFRFENVWLQKPMCKQIVEEVWYRLQGCSMQEKMQTCSEMLFVWGKEITGSFRTRISQCKRVMRKTKGRRDGRSVQQYKEAANNLNEIYIQ